MRALTPHRASPVPPWFQPAYRGDMRDELADTTIRGPTPARPRFALQEFGCPGRDRERLASFALLRIGVESGPILLLDIWWWHHLHRHA